MNSDGMTSWPRLLEGLRRGDEASRRELLERAYGRLRRLAGAMLHRHFPDLRDRHELDSALNEAWIRLAQALESVTPATPDDFFRLAAHKVRQVLLDMVGRQRRDDAREKQDADTTSPYGRNEPSDHSLEPGKLALWSEFHAKAEQLPPLEKSVFDLHYYLDMSQADIAETLGLHPRKVSRLWVSATERLADLMPEASLPSPEPQ